MDFALKSFVLLLMNSSISLRPDNFTTSVITINGSNIIYVQKLAESIYQTPMENCVGFEISWDQEIKM